MQVYCVYDLRTKSLLKPFFAENDVQAMRGFAAAIANPETDFARYPEDFELMEIAVYDAENGVFTNHEPPFRMVCQATQVQLPVVGGE